MPKLLPTLEEQIDRLTVMVNILAARIEVLEQQQEKNNGRSTAIRRTEPTE